jgi:hypothetical protein
MKPFRIILISFLFITACQLQQVKKHDDLKERSPITEDSQASDVKNTPKQLTPGVNQIAVIEQSDHNSGTETAIQKSDSQEIFRIESGNRKIVIPVTDAVSRKLLSRKIPGIEWVEQSVDARTILKIHFENDLITYANTDRYFTNGIRFDLQAAWLAGSPIQKLMIPYRHKSFVIYNLSMVQNMYTPTDTRVAPHLSNDRPYSSVLYFGIRKTVADLQHNLLLSFELNLGYIGPYSLGSSLQSIVHKTFPTNDKPLGWETQINSDIILNYSVQAQQALVKKENLTLLAGLNAEAGTLYTNAGAGLQLQAGKAEPIFGLMENEEWPELEYYFFAKTDFSFVVYNALLQGGMFNHDNVFSLKQNEIQHVVGNAEAGIHFRLKGIGMEIAQHFISPEYKGGLWHKWGRISLIFKL